MATANKRLKVLGANTIKGYSVFNNAGEKLGKIEEFMIDPNRGSIAFAVISFGGIMGMGSKLFPVPWSALLLSHPDKKVVIQADVEALKSAPGFKKADKDTWPEMADREWATRIYEHYRYMPYAGEDQEQLRPGRTLEGREREYHIRPSNDHDERIVIKP